MRGLAPVVGGANPRASSQRRKRSEVIKTFGVSKTELESLEKAGVPELEGDGETAGYSGIGLELLDLVADVRRPGLDIFRHRVRTADALPAPLPEVAKQAVDLGERLIVSLRAKILPALLGALLPR